MASVDHAMRLRPVTPGPPKPIMPAVVDQTRLGLMVSGLVHKGKQNLKRGIKEVAENFNKLVTLSSGQAMPLAVTVDALMERRSTHESRSVAEHFCPPLAIGSGG